MSRLFHKLTNGGHRLYAKIKSEAPKLFGKLSNGLHSVGGYIDKGIEFANKHKDILNYLPSEFSAPTKTLINAASKASHLIKQSSHLTNPNSYAGNIGDVAHDALQRAMRIKDDHKDLIKFN
jgi:hypothetical protein